MSDDVVNLASEKATRSGDSRQWSVTNCLDETLEQSRDGRWTKAVLVLYRPDGHGYFEVDFRCAGVTTLEARGLLFSQIKAEILNEEA